MSKLSIILIVIFFPLYSVSQQFSLLTALHDSVKETSGLIYLNGKIITHNDSGGEPALYELDSLTGNVLRRVIISNAYNWDWEDICYDSTYIYIADMGNNNGSRTNLRIYKVLITDYFNTPNDSISSDVIQFSYADQTDFTSTTYTTNFDAEALISYNDSLYIFTKNWGNKRTNLYALPKTIGNYSINKKDSLDVQGLITGAVYNSKSNSVLLSGYTFDPPFVVELKGFNSTNFFDGGIERYVITPPTGYSIQIESITSFNTNTYLLTAEKNASGSSALYKWISPSTLGIELINDSNDSIFPNPTTQEIQIVYENFDYVEFYNMNGVKIKTLHQQHINISEFSKGIYILVIVSNDNISVTKKLVIN